MLNWHCVAGIYVLHGWHKGEASKNIDKVSPVTGLDHRGIRLSRKETKDRDTRGERVRVNEVEESKR